MNGDWGFCPFCAFEVAVDDGLLVGHDRFAGSYDRVECPGSGRKAEVQPGPEAEPIRLVRLTRTLTQINARKRYRDEVLRRRAAAQRRKADMRLLVNPNRVEIFNPETGETADITDAIVGPIRLNTEPGLEEDEPDGDHAD